MKTLLTVLFAALLLPAAWFGYRYFNPVNDRPQFRTLPVTRGDLMTGVTATGMVEPEKIDVGAQIVGMIKSFGPDRDRPGKTIDFNSRIKEGDVLAQLDDRPHRVALEKAVAGLKLAEAELRQSRAQRDKAKLDLEREKRLEGTDSKAALEAASSQFEISQATLAICEAKVAQAECAKKDAEINLDYTTIRSPVNGTIIDRRVNIGQTVVAGLNAPSLFLLAKDLNHMQVLASVNEADIGAVKVGQKVTFKVDEHRNTTFTGTVSQSRLNAAMASSVVTYSVVVDVDNTDGRLRPYTTAKLQFEVEHRSNVLKIPDQALRWRPTWEQISPAARSGLTPPAKQKQATGSREQGAVEGEDEATVSTGAPTAWVLADDGLVRPVPVNLGISDSIDTELIGGGLSAKDEVVINAERAARPDFVSSFINKIVEKK
jgi:HlyD family secretion protein